MKRFLIGLSVFLSVSVIALVLYLAITDFSRYKLDFAAAISEATGREFKIDGEFKPEVFPLSFVAEEISLANADWASDAPFLTVGHISIKIDPASLIAGPLRITEFRLHDVAILLEVNEAGEDNWTMATEEPEFEYDTGDVQGDIILLDFADVRNIQVTYRAAGNEDRVATLASLDVHANDIGYIEVTGFGQVDSSDLTVNASVGPVDNIDSGADVAFNFESYLGEVALSVSGNSGDPDTLVGSKMDLVLTSDDVATVSRLMNTETDVSGPLRVEANLSPHNGQALLVVNADVADLNATSEISISGEQLTFDATVSPLQRFGDIVGIRDLPDAPLSAKGVVNVKSDRFEISNIVAELQSVQADIEGTVGRSSRIATDLALTLSVDNLNELQSDLPTLALNGDFGIRIDGEQIKLDPFALEFADSDLGGMLDLDLSEPMSVTGNLRSELLDLTPFADPQDEESSSATPAEPAAEQEAGEQEFVFDDDPLPFEFLNAAAVDLQLLIVDFRQGPLRLNDLQADVKLAEGKLTLESGFTVTDGGSASTVMSLASNGDNSADLDMDFEIADLRLSLSEDSERDVADIPLVGLAADFSSSGGSLRQIASGMNGKILFTQGSGKIDNKAIDFFSNDIISQLFGALNPFAKDEPISIWDCTVFALDIKDGIAEIKPFLAQSEKLTIVAEGNIDLTSEQLDIRFNTKPRRGVGVSADMFVTPFIQLGGSMAAPRMELDKKGVIVSGGAAILTGGISFFVQGAADRASGGTDRCAAALAIANGQEIEME